MLTHVKLDESADEVWRMWDEKYNGRQDHKRPIITAAGYDKLNLFGSVKFPPVRTLIGDDGAEHPNPYMEREANGDLRCVRVQRIGIAMDPVGNLVFRDLTLTFNLATYFATDLYKKWRFKKDATPKAWGQLWDAQVPFVPPKEGRWKGYRVPGDAMLYVDLTHEDVITLLMQKNHRESMAERTAITMAERNICKKFYAAAKLDESLTVRVVSWVQADRDLAQLGDMVAAARRGEAVVDGMPVMVEQEIIDAEFDEASATIEAETDETCPPDEPDEPEPASVAPTAPKAENPQRLEFANARTKIRMIAQRLGDAALEVIAGYDVDGLEEVAQLGNLETLKAIQADLEKLDTPAARKGKNQEQLPL